MTSFKLSIKHYTYIDQLNQFLEENGTIEDEIATFTVGNSIYTVSATELLDLIDIITSDNQDMIKFNAEYFGITPNMAIDQILERLVITDDDLIHYNKTTYNEGFLETKTNIDWNGDSKVINMCLGTKFVRYFRYRLEHAAQAHYYQFDYDFSLLSLMYMFNERFPRLRKETTKYDDLYTYMYNEVTVWHTISELEQAVDEVVEYLLHYKELSDGTIVKNE